MIRKPTVIGSLSIDTYRDQDAYDNQEVVTPPELVEEMYSYLEERDFLGDIMDPCVGPGAMSIPLLDKNYNSLTVCDIQKMHVKEFNDKYDSVIVNHVISTKHEDLNEW